MDGRKQHYGGCRVWWYCRCGDGGEGDPQMLYNRSIFVFCNKENISLYVTQNILDFITLRKMCSITFTYD